MIECSILDYLSDFLFDSKNEDEWIYWCPWCESELDQDNTHAHLYVSTQTLKWFCHRCQRNGKEIDPVLKMYGIQLSYQDKLSFFLKAETTEANVIVPPDKKSIDPSFEEEMEVIQPDTKAHRYLQNKRGIPSDAIASEWAVWSKHPGYVFWFHRDSEGKVDFYSGRAYLKKAYPKYLHTPGSKPFILFNGNKCIASPKMFLKPLVFLVEGLFDALLAPGTSIPMWGKTITKNLQAPVLNALQEKNAGVVCCLDQEEFEDNIKLAKFLHERGITEIYLFDLYPHKDFGEGDFVEADIQNIHSRLYRFSGNNAKLLELQMGR